MSEDPIKLTSRQAAFVAEYLIDLNGTQAAIRAGYSAYSANVIAAENLAKPSIADAIERGKAQRLSRVNMTQDTVLHEMSILANSSYSHYFVDEFGNVQLADGAPDGAMGAIQWVKKTVKHGMNGEVTYNTEFRLWDKPGPLKLMGKHTGLNFTDRVEHTGKDGGPLEIIAKVERVIIDETESSR